MGKVIYRTFFEKDWPASSEQPEVSTENVTHEKLTKDSILVKVDGDELTFKEQPYIENGTTMVPFRQIFEKLGLGNWLG